MRKNQTALLIRCCIFLLESGKISRNLTDAAFKVQLCCIRAPDTIPPTHLSSFLIATGAIITVSHSSWIHSSPVSQAICYCSKKRAYGLTQSWSWNCNVCWCCRWGNYYYYYFFTTTAHIVYMCTGMFRKTNQRLTWDMGYWWCRHANISSYMIANLHAYWEHADKWLTKCRNKIAVNR